MAVIPSVAKYAKLNLRSDAKSCTNSTKACVAKESGFSKAKEKNVCFRIYKYVLTRAAVFGKEYTNHIIDDKALKRQELDILLSDLNAEKRANHYAPQL